MNVRNFNSLSLHAPVWGHLRDWWPTFNRQTSDPLVVPSHSSECHHWAWHRAYRHFAQQYPHWVQRRFDDKFLLCFVHASTLPTAAMLALAWDRQFGLLASPSIRCQQKAELIEVAESFLRCYHQERQQLQEMNTR